MKSDTESKPRPSLANILTALPAFFAVVLSGVVVLVATLARPSPEALIERYQRDADHAITIGDVPTAQLCAQRLVQLDPADPLHRERLTLVNAMRK